MVVLVELKTLKQKKNKKCLCCQISALSKKHTPTHKCQSIPDLGRVDDIITKLESGNFESVRYGCKVEIDGILEFKSGVINEFSNFGGTLKYDLTQIPNFDGNSNDTKKIIIVESSTLYCIGISIFI